MLRELANVIVLNPSVSSNSVMFAGSSPRTTDGPVINPIVSTAGIVSPIVANTDLSKMLIDRF